MLLRGAASLNRLAAVALMLAVASLAAPGAEAQRKKTTTAANPITTLRVIVPDMVDAAGVLRGLIPDFERRHRIGVRVVPADLKIAIKLVQENKADVLLSADHEAAMRIAKAREKTGYEDVMYADLLIVGPAGDPAKIAGMSSMITAFEAIAKAEAAFISRGDGSATNLVELRAWVEAGIEPKPSDNPWYTLTGADTRTTLGLAAAKSAYTLTDRATWLRFRTRKQLIVMVDHDPRLMLRFGAQVVTPASGSAAQKKAAQAFVVWLTSKAVQEKIGAYRVGSETPFAPHYGLQR